MPRPWVRFSPNSLPVVWARLAQHRFRVLVDSGATRSLIAPAAASSLGLSLIGTERIIGVIGTVATVPLVEVIGVGMATIDIDRHRALDQLYPDDQGAADLLVTRMPSPRPKGHG